MRRIIEDRRSEADFPFHDVVERVRLAQKKINVSGIRGSVIALFSAILYRNVGKTLLIITPSLEGARTLQRDLILFLQANDVLLCPPRDLLSPDIFSTREEVETERADVLTRLAMGKSAAVVVPAETLLQKVAPPDMIRDYLQTVSIGDQVEREALLNKLDAGGYRRVSIVEERGEYSVRGHVMDIFPPPERYPLRLLFLGDEVESIKTFEADSQRSIEELVEFTLSPAREVIVAESLMKDALKNLRNRANDIEISRLMRDRLLDMIGRGGVKSLPPRMVPLFPGAAGDHFLSYVPADSVLVFSDPLSVEREEEKALQGLKHAVEKAKNEGAFYLDPEQYLLSVEDLHRALDPFQKISLHSLEIARGSDEDFSPMFRFEMETLPVLRDDKPVRKGEESPLHNFVERIGAWIEEGRLVTLLCSGEGGVRKISNLLEGYSLSVQEGKGDFLSQIIGHDGKGKLVLREGRISEGFIFPPLKWVVIGDEEIFGRKERRRRAKSAREGYFLRSFGELKEGDFVVHADHGIGMYNGLEKLTVGPVENDFLLLEYLEGDKLYLPVDRLDQIQRYIGPDGHDPKVDRLGGTSWEATKKRVRRSVEEIAQELVSLYAARETLERHAFSPPDPYYEEFASAFEYEETPDQMNAIEDVNGDMADSKPMDRLICGDAGFGKTEVAIRAAFRAVMDGKQAAVLVPTTILAEQHFHTFSSRLERYPVRVEALNRFKTKNEQRKIVEELRKGTVDIVIGTHRLLQKDVAFKELGLVVVDEEQRFGVKDKEKLKQLRTLVDVLTLTATPIPRTLQLSLVGIRDLSVISTPPRDRLTIRTHVLEFDEEAIQKAIRTELERHGQVFFVHDRIQSIYTVARLLERLVPEAGIRVAHGRMKGKELEDVMVKFVRRESNVLVCTTIIGSGIDIPSANTIIINRADRFGLSQLYQLRGRVGRSKEGAFAYLLVPKGALLSPDAQKRLQVVGELTEPGAGFTIATHDLEIRGAGNILGTSQSGHVAAVGYEMYIQLIENTIRELRGEKTLSEEEVRPEIHLGLPAFIPEEYISDMHRRLITYKRISMAATEDDLEGLREEMIDCYGVVAPQVDYLFEVIRIRNLARQVMAKRVEYDGKNLALSFMKESKMDPGKIMTLIRRKAKGTRFTPEYKLFVPLPGLGHDDIVRETKGLLKELMN